MKTNRFHDEDTPDENVNEINEVDECFEEAHFRKHIFYVVLDNVIGGITVRISAAKHISDSISFFGNYQKISNAELKRRAAILAEKYSEDISSKYLVLKISSIIMLHNANYLESCWEYWNC